MSDDQRQHLTFIQDVITRMNSNSFSLKGLMITIVAALSALFAGNYGRATGIIYLSIAALLVVVFWLLDAYYLKMERQYRRLYDDAVAGAVEPYAMDASGYAVSFWGVVFSRTVWPVYLPLLAVIVVVAVILMV